MPELYDENDDGAVHVPVDGLLDLHLFSPKEACDLVDEYLRVCVEKGIYEVKIVHGKGKGVLRRKVHSLLERHPLVKGFGLDSGPSGWGATVAFLKFDSKNSPEQD